jgi:predicted DNA-binding transcriptional regulator AlpA
MEQPRLVPVKDAQAVLGGISRATFYRMVEKGDLKLRKIGSRSFVRSDELTAFIDGLEAA